MILLKKLDNISFARRYMAKKIGRWGEWTMATSAVRAKEVAKTSEAPSNPSFESGKLRTHILFYAIMAATLLGVSVQSRPYITLAALIAQITLLCFFVKSAISQHS
jgi:hypothetical protein